MEYNRPKVGLAVFVTSDEHPGCVLLGKRKGSIGEGTYATPGGHLEFSETFEDCAKRETYEETELVLKDIIHEGTVNVIWPEENYHYVDIIMTGKIDKDYNHEPKNTEPHKCHGWSWFDWNCFPPDEDLFVPLKTIRKSGYNPFTKQS